MQKNLNKRRKALLKTLIKEYINIHLDTFFVSNKKKHVLASGWAETVDRSRINFE